MGNLNSTALESWLLWKFIWPRFNGNVIFRQFTNSVLDNRQNTALNKNWYPVKGIQNKNIIFCQPIFGMHIAAGHCSTLPRYTFNKYTLFTWLSPWILKCIILKFDSSKTGVLCRLQGLTEEQSKPKKSYPKKVVSLLSNFLSKVYSTWEGLIASADSEPEINSPCKKISSEYNKDLVKKEQRVWSSVI